MAQILLKNCTIDPPVLLSPLAGITDLPFRNLVQSFGAGLVVSEMVASQEMVQARPSTRARAELGFGADSTSIQIAGRDAYWMAECAKLCADQGARIIDINMGCPAKKVTNGLSGSALLKTPDFALELIEAVVEAVDIPVTLKTRLGWDDNLLNAPEVAKRAEAAGIEMITIHGRTRCQFYKGQADWKAIRDVVNAVTIPVIANGDITDVKTAKTALNQSGAAGVMVGRGAQGRPWLLAEIAAELYGTNPPQVPVGEARKAMIEQHYEAMIAFYGVELGNRVARKHLGWYLDDFDVSAEFRMRIQTEKDTKKVRQLIRDLPTEMGAAA